MKKQELFGTNRSQNDLARMASVVVVALAFLSLLASEAVGQTFVSQPVTPLKVTIDLSKLPPEAPTHQPGKPLGVIPGTVFPPGPPQPPDPVRQTNTGGIGKNSGALVGVTPSQFTTPSPSFPGMNGGGFPPDTNGAPSLNHYIQTINVFFAVWDKKGSLKAGPTKIQSLWDLAGAPNTNQCRTNNGAGGNYFASDHTFSTTILPTAG